MRRIGARHGNGAALVFEAIESLIGNWLVTFFFGVVSSKATALVHEVFDDTVKNSVVIGAGIDIAQKVFNRFRSIN